MTNSDSGNALLLVESEPRSGAWNMAIDEVLLEHARQQNLLAVRFYRWSEPTLSLGYFQKELPADLPDDLRGLASVKRLSGGGAILHHHEWTYSCVLPPSHPIAGEPTELYGIIHRQIVAWLGELGIPTRLRGEPENEADALFLCFGRQDPRDIVTGTHKVVGSAQRRRRGAVLQHGSLLLQQSPFALEYPGVLDLHPIEENLDPHIPKLAERCWTTIANPLGVPQPVIQSELPTNITEFAKSLLIL